MSVVASLSAVLAAVIPATVGIALGDHLSAPEAAGMVLAIPAIALVSLSAGSEGGRRPGIREGLIAGAAFGFFFVALDRAGTASGAWPLLPGEAVTLAIAIPLGLRMSRGDGHRRAAIPYGAVAGILGALATASFFFATGKGASPWSPSSRRSTRPSRSSWQSSSSPNDGADHRAWACRRPPPRSSYQRRLRPVLRSFLQFAVLRRELIRPAR